MDLFKTWKKGFDAWEKVTAEYMETVLRSPAILEPSGAMLGQVMKGWANANTQLAKFWGGMGVSTKRDQERALHALNQIQSRLLDIEERLQSLEK